MRPLVSDDGNIREFSQLVGDDLGVDTITSQVLLRAIFMCRSAQHLAESTGRRLRLKKAARSLGQKRPTKKKRKPRK